MFPRCSVVVVLFAAGCTGGGVASPTPSPDTASPSPTTSPSVTDPSLVGEWVGTYDCDAIAETLRSAGLEEVVLEVVTGTGLIPGAESPEDLADPSQPCEGAVAVEHGHFFTADGQFGSRDSEGNQVDEGTFEIVGDDTVIINGVELGYSVEGDELVLESIPEGCVDDECIYSIMVSMPGTTLHRQE